MQASLIKFESAGAIDELLRWAGVANSLGPFLAEHLTQVFQQQYSDLVIHSLELISVYDCTVDGRRCEVKDVVGVTSFSIPMDVRLVVTAESRACQLDVLVSLNARTCSNSIDFTSDVLVRQQFELDV